MDNHIKAARAHLALAWLYGLALVALGAWHYLGREPALALDTLLATGVLLLVLSIAHAVLARAARVRRPWARLLSLLAGFVLLLLFPIGTLFGLILIGASWSPWPLAHTHAGSPSGAWPKDAVRDRPRAGR